MTRVSPRSTGEVVGEEAHRVLVAVDAEPDDDADGERRIGVVPELFALVDVADGPR